MLKRCGRCGKPIYASSNTTRTECTYCYAEAIAGNLEPLSPADLDWRKPLYDAAVLMPPGKTARQRFSFLSSYGHAAQRMELCEKETALEADPIILAPAEQKALRSTLNLLASRIVSYQPENASKQLSDSRGEQPSEGADASRAYDANPFSVLGATTRNTREELVMLQKDEALFGNGQAADDALAALTHPESRLEIEMHWFPLATTEEIGHLLGYLKTSQEASSLSAFVPRMRSSLAQFNAVKLVLDVAPIENLWDFRAHILSLATLADALFAEQVLDEINADRNQALFAPLQYLSNIETQIEQLLNETLSLVLARKPHSMTRIETTSLQRHFDRAYRNRNSIHHNSYFLELASELLIDQ